MRKIVSFVFIIMMVVSAVSCSKNTEKPTNPTETVTQTVKKSETKSNLNVRRGIDVSSFNGEIDWERVKNNNIHFAIIRIGGRAYGEKGIIYPDKTAVYNLKQAIKHRIKTGVYFFSQATSDKEAKEEAKFVAKTLGDIKIYLPVGYDVEHIKSDSARIDNVSYKNSVRFAKVFMKTIKKLGYEPMVYTGGDSILKFEDFRGYKIWYAGSAKYNHEEKLFYIRQTATDGEVDGIKGKVDLNIMYE